jgi:hypothetical protein
MTTPQRLSSCVADAEAQRAWSAAATDAAAVEAGGRAETCHQEEGTGSAVPERSSIDRR